MDTLRELIPKIKSIETNIDGSSESFDNLTLLEIYKIAYKKIEEISLKYNIINFTLPKINGYNSLVIYADSLIYKYALKIVVSNKSNINMIDSIYKHVSENQISPKIYYDHNIDYNSQNYMIKITLSERLILFSDFKWNSIYQLKNSIISLIYKTIKLHSLGYVHNDIKYENLGLDSHGNIYIFDYDNFSEITKTFCSKLLSSNVCHPPDKLIAESISNGLGNQIIDLFSISIIILGDIIGINSWHFDNSQLYEKEYQITNFKRNKIHNIIQKEINKKFNHDCFSNFWFSLINFIHLIFQKNHRIKNKRSFTCRAKKLIERMRRNLCLNYWM